MPPASHPPSTSSRPRAGVARFAPYACVALLVVFMLAGGLHARTPAGADTYRAAVRTVIESIPYKVGPAVGADVEPTRAAQLLLTPNKIFQRRYTDPSTGWGFSLLIVHCNDARDMRGHYPPNCYPRHGWQQDSAENASLPVDGVDQPAMCYRFSRNDEITARAMTIYDFFIIPDGGGSIFADMKKMGFAARSSEVGGLGVAQVQVVFDDDSSPAWRREMLEEIMPAITPTLRVVGQGVRP